MVRDENRGLEACCELSLKPWFGEALTILGIKSLQLCDRLYLYSTQNQEAYLSPLECCRKLSKVPGQKIDLV